MLWSHDQAKVWKDFGRVRMYVFEVPDGWAFSCYGDVHTTPEEEALRFATAKEGMAYADTWAAMKGVK